MGTNATYPSRKNLLANGQVLYIYSMGKRFPVTAIFTDSGKANAYMESHPEQALIAVTGDPHEQELFFIAEK